MSDQRLFVKAKCPYCGYINQLPVDPRGTLEPLPVLCDCDDGDGCGEYFAITVIFKPQVRIYSMRQLEAV